MGTPGDKAQIGKVVHGGPLDPDRDRSGSAPPPPSTTSASASPQPTTSSSAMVVISRLPQFDTIAAFNIHPSLAAHTSTSASSKSDPFQTGLEQAHIEDYYAQTKYYPSASETFQTVYPATPPKEPEPGPSGLQTPKSKPIPKVNAKRARKQLHQKKGHVCGVCQKTFATSEKLSKHQQVHSGASPFKCEHCKKSFSSKFKLVRHVLIHSDRKPFSCTVCERTFHRKDHLKNHIKVHSPSKKIYLCEKSDCKKEYTSLMSYRKHLALHSAEDGSLECQICSSVFASKEEILYHLKIHAGSRTVKNPNEKKFTCDQCGRKFFTKKDVRRHLVVHTGMRDFLCQFCPQRFGRKDHLVRHIKKSHSKNVKPEDIETAIKSETVVKPEPEPDFSESSLSNPPFTFQLDEILQHEPFEFFQPETFLPSTSTQEELKDLGGNILEVIGEELADPEILAQSVLNNPDLLVVQPSEIHTPLPGFSQTFQPPPPP